MQKKSFSAFTACFGLLTLSLCAAVCYGTNLYTHHGTSQLKALTSAGFVLIGVVNLLYALFVRAGNKGFLLGMLTGFVLSLVGDVAIDPSFLQGAIAFALAHLCYWAAYCFSSGFYARDLFCGAALFGISALLLISPLFTFRRADLLQICLAYAAVISLMVGKSIATFVRRRTVCAALLMFGSALFYFSDLMLVLGRFGGLRSAGSLCIATYYPAQCLLGLSLFSHVFANAREKITA